MCGRYQFSVGTSEVLRALTEEVARRGIQTRWREGDVAPTSRAPVLVSGSGRMELFHWGYRLPNTLVINARAETAEEKPLFRESLAARRCLVPASGYYEWDAEKRQYLFTLPGAGHLYMAGLYDLREGRGCYCILTTRANASAESVHPRMPLVLREEDAHLWLREDGASARLLRSEPPALEKRSVDPQLRLW